MHAAVSPAPVPLIPLDLNIADRIQSDLLLPEQMPDGDRPVRNGTGNERDDLDVCFFVPDPECHKASPF